MVAKKVEGWLGHVSLEEDNKTLSEACFTFCSFLQSCRLYQHSLKQISHFIKWAFNPLHCAQILCWNLPWSGLYPAFRSCFWWVDSFIPPSASPCALAHACLCFLGHDICFPLYDWLFPLAISWTSRSVLRGPMSRIPTALWSPLVFPTPCRLQVSEWTDRWERKSGGL